MRGAHRVLVPHRTRDCLFAYEGGRVEKRTTRVECGCVLGCTCCFIPQYGVQYMWTDLQYIQLRDQYVGSGGMF